MALYHAHHKVISRSTRNTVASLAYRSGTALVNSQTGEVSDYTKKNVNHVEVLLPTDAPTWAKDVVELVKEDKEAGLQKLSDLVESAEKRLDAQIYREFEIALPRELSNEQNMALANEFVQDQLCGRGMLAIQNFHFDLDEKTGEKKPHCHTLLLTRRLTADGLSLLKERAWNSKELHNDLREKWAAYVNFHLKMHGFEMRVDHRSYAARGIDLEAQPKMGKGALEVARKLGTRPIEAGLEESREKGKDSSPLAVPQASWRWKDFLDVKVRNAYRILANPEVVLDVISSTQSVFGVKDLKKVIGRYTDDVALKDRLLAKVLASSEMVVLGTSTAGTGADRDASRRLLEIGLMEARLILTTASQLKAELSLVAEAKALGQRTSPHWEKPEAGAYNAILKGFETREGFALSEEQRQAVTHMVSGSQLSCIVGYAGAGKTTALKVAKEVFEYSGYAVVGLAPTGRAAQNLQESGIFSQTLHRFLHQFEGGRNQLRPKTVLVLDEAGMVDVKLFDGFLKAVEKLGVKAIVVGDGAQLQAVGAGDAFRLVTKALDPIVMADVRRQTLDWQREATKAFGRLETREALESYLNKGHVTFVKEKVPTLEKLVEAKDLKGIVDLYTLSRRMVTRHVMTRDGVTGHHVTEHDVMNHKEGLPHWKDVKLSCATHMATNLDVFRSHMEKGRVDPLGFASHFVDGKTRAEREPQAAEIAQRWRLSPLTGGSPTLGSTTGESRSTQIDGRTETKAAMVAAWKASVKTHPTSSHLMLAYANQDVADLNKFARAFLREMGLIKGAEFTYATSKVTRQGEQQTIEKTFAVGDRLMFGKNDRGLDVKNGMMGTVESLSASKIVVRLDGANAPSSSGRLVSETPVSGRRVSFSPKLYPFFDHGFAVTTHKAQGITVDRVFKLASFEEYRNLAYVGMTRHREDVQVFGSKLDFWREGVFLDRLSAENNKQAIMDTAPKHALKEKVETLPSSLTRTFERMGNHLEAMGFVAKHLYQTIVNTFLQAKETEPDLMDLPSFAMTDSVKADVKEQETGRDIFHSPEALTLIKAGETAGLSDPKAFALRGLEERKLLSERGETFSPAHLQTLIQRVGYEERKWEEIHAITKDDFMRRLDVDHLSLLHLLALEKETQKMAALESRIFAEHAAQNKPLTDSEIFIEAMGEMKALAAEQKTLEKSLSEHHTPFVAKMVSEEIVRLKATHGEGPSAAKVQQCIYIVQEVEKKHANHARLEETSVGVEKTLSQRDHDRAAYTKAFEAREGLKALSMGKTQISDTERQKIQEVASTQFERQEKNLENERQQQQSKELVFTR